MNVEKALKHYIEKILNCARSHKVLYLDKETTGIISQLLSSTQALEEDVFLIHELGVPFKSEANVGHLIAIIFVRPTEENLAKIKDHLSKPRHKTYNLFFSNQLPEQDLAELAYNDKYKVVSQVQEFYADYYPITKYLWSLNQPDQCKFYTEEKTWDQDVQTNWNRQVDGLAAFLLSVKKNPIIRYHGKSELARKMSKELASVISSEKELFGWQTVGERPLLLILDRREDPVTPLLLQWTYQAMVHEILEIHNSRVDMQKYSTKELDEARKELIMNPFNDKFFNENLIENYGTIAEKTQKLMKKYQINQKQGQNLKTIEAMSNFIENYPKFLAEQGNTAKHISIVSKLSENVKGRNLLNISELQQDIIVTYNQKEHLKNIEIMIKNPKLNDQDKLILVLLYTLRYEKKMKSNDHSSLRTLLRNNTNLKQRRIAIVEALIRNFGLKSRGTVLFQEEKSGFMNQFKRFTKRTIKGLDDVECVFTQHNPQLAKIIDDAIAGKLEITQYPSQSGSFNKNSPNDILIYMVGGATYEESLTVHNKNKENKNINIVLGAPNIINSNMFLEDIEKHFVHHLETNDDDNINTNTKF